MNRPVFAFLPLVAIGCATPTSGEYIFEEIATSSNCPEADEDTDAEPTEDATVTVTVSEDKATVTIFSIDFPLVGTSFEGEVFNGTTDYNDSGLDAVVTSYSDISGNWVSSTRITGTQNFASSCEGTYCADMEGMGAAFCSGSADYEATLQE